MKKIVIFALILIFLFSFMEHSFAQSGVSVSLSDNYIGHSTASTAYDIVFVSNNELVKGSTVSILFDNDIPIFRNSEEVDEITINGFKVSESPEFFGHRIDISLPLSVKKGETVKVHIPLGIVQNPTSTGYFILKIEAAGFTYTSNYYHITDKSTVKDVKLSKTSDGIEIDFDTGFNGSLEGYKTETVGAGWFTFTKPVPQDFIFIRFSHVLSKSFSSISKNNITVNGYNPPINPSIKTHFEDTDREEKEIAICVPKDINANSSVKVLIKNITVPQNETGLLYVSVWTSKEPMPVKSNEISVKSNYFLETNLTLSPETPDGKNGFYKTQPTVSLDVDKGRGIEKTETYYSFNGKDFLLYSKPLNITDGNKTLYYYSVGYTKNRKITEDTHSAEFLVDSTPPEISVVSQSTSTTPLYDLRVNISDENFDYAVITVYGINFTVMDKECDLPIYLFDKSTAFTVKAYDKAGNISEFNGKIILKG